MVVVVVIDGGLRPWPMMRLEMAMNDVRMMAVVGSRKMDVLGWQNAEREQRKDREHRRGLLSTGTHHHGALSVPAKAQSNRRVRDPIVRRHDSSEIIGASTNLQTNASFQCDGLCPGAERSRIRRYSSRGR